MALVDESAIFSAAIVKDTVWLFSSEDAVTTKLMNAGMKLEPVTTSLYGYKVMTVDMLKD